MDFETEPWPSISQQAKGAHSCAAMHNPAAAQGSGMRLLRGPASSLSALPHTMCLIAAPPLLLPGPLPGPARKPPLLSVHDAMARFNLGWPGQQAKGLAWPTSPLSQRLSRGSPGADIVLRLLTLDPAARATTEELLRHPWMAASGAAPESPLGSVVITRMRRFAGMNKLKKVGGQGSGWTGGPAG